MTHQPPIQLAEWTSIVLVVKQKNWINMSRRPKEEILEKKYKFYLNFRLNRRAKKIGHPLEPIKSPMMITMKFYDSKANIFEKIHLQLSSSA